MQQTNKQTSDSYQSNQRTGRVVKFPLPLKADFERIHVTGHIL